MFPNTFQCASEVEALYAYNCVKYGSLGQSIEKVSEAWPLLPKGTRRRLKKAVQGCTIVFAFDLAPGRGVCQFEFTNSCRTFNAACSKAWLGSSEYEFSTGVEYSNTELLQLKCYRRILVFPRSFYVFVENSQKQQARVKAAFEHLEAKSTKPLPVTPGAPSTATATVLSYDPSLAVFVFHSRLLIPQSVTGEVALAHINSFDEIVIWFESVVSGERLSGVPDSVILKVPIAILEAMPSEAPSSPSIVRTEDKDKKEILIRPSHDWVVNTKGQSQANVILSYKVKEPVRVQFRVVQRTLVRLIEELPEECRPKTMPIGSSGIVVRAHLKASEVGK